MLILLLFLIISIELIVVSCCAMAGSDPLSRYISDLEQIQYIRNWNIEKKDRLK